MEKQNLKRTGYKTLTISPEIWRKLWEIKMDNHFRSLDEVIIYLLNKKRQGGKK